ncbi:hypothetical protein LL251_17195 [Sphingobium naphthae]|nr:hypothetical protein [Sphingobium naphthae]
MSRNPFGPDTAAPAGQSEERLLALCQEHNRWAYKIGYRKWYFVQPATDAASASIQTVDGIAADEVWTVSRGERLNYASWSSERLDKLERRCRWLIERGMPADDFANLCARYRWANPRSVAA